MRSQDSKEELFQRGGAAAKRASAGEQGQAEVAKEAFCKLAELDPSYKGAGTNCKIWKKGVNDLEAKDQELLRKGKSQIDAQLFDAAVSTLSQVATSSFKERAQSLIAEANAKKAEAQAELAKQEQERKQKEENQRQQAQAEAKKADDEAKLKQQQEAARHEREAQDKLYNGAFQKYQNNDFVGAAADLKAVTGARESDARALLQKIKTYQQAMNDGDNAFQKKLWHDAIVNYRKAQGIKPDGPNELARKLREANSEEARLEAKLAGGDSNKILIQGIQSFYEGDYDSAEARFAAYVGDGKKKALRDFYLGASFLSRSYLSADADQREKLRLEAEHAFRDAKRAGSFRPPSEQISPKILKAYQAVPSA